MPTTVKTKPPAKMAITTIIPILRWLELLELTELPESLDPELPELPDPPLSDTEPVAVGIANSFEPNPTQLQVSSSNLQALTQTQIFR